MWQDQKSWVFIWGFVILVTQINTWTMRLSKMSLSFLSYNIFAVCFALSPLFIIFIDFKSDHISRSENIWMINIFMFNKWMCWDFSLFLVLVAKLWKTLEKIMKGCYFLCWLQKSTVHTQTVFQWMWISLKIKYYTHLANVFLLDTQKNHILLWIDYWIELSKKVGNIWNNKYLHLKMNWKWANLVKEVSNDTDFEWTIYILKQKINLTIYQNGFQYDTNMIESKCCNFQWLRHASLTQNHFLTVS